MFRSTEDSKGGLHHFTVFADYGQFLLHDETEEGDLTLAWSPQAASNLLAIAPGTIGVGTIEDGFVLVELQIAESETTDEFREWHHVTECDISIPSGTLLVAGCTDTLEEAHRVRVNPGDYRARIFYGGLYSSEIRRGLYSHEYYKVVLWPSQLKGVVVLKRWVDVVVVETSIS